MGDEMQGGAGNRGDGEEAEEPPGAEAARHRAAERQEPDRIDADMDEVGMEERIGEEGPDLGAEPAGETLGSQTMS